MHRVRGRFYNFPPYIRDNCGIWQEILYDIWTFVMSSEGILKCKFQCCSKYYCEDGQMRICHDTTAPRIMLNFIRIRHGKNRVYKMHQFNPQNIKFQSKGSTQLPRMAISALFLHQDIEFVDQGISIHSYTVHSAVAGHWQNRGSAQCWLAAC